MSFALRPYQEEALASISTNLENGINKQLVVLPTGAGKTVIFSHLPKVLTTSLPMLVLAHR
jgi:superfamily II DNA or RNA helicase